MAISEASIQEAAMSEASIQEAAIPEEAIQEVAMQRVMKKIIENVKSAAWRIRTKSKNWRY